MNNVLNKVVEIEDTNGNTILAFMLDDKGNIIKMNNCSVADEDCDYIFNTEKDLIRIQAD